MSRLEVEVMRRRDEEEGMWEASFVIGSESADDVKWDAAHKTRKHPESCCYSPIEDVKLHQSPR